MKMTSNKTSWCPGLCWSVVWLLIWFLAWPMAFILAVVEVFLIPFCVCFEKAKTACEFIDRIYKVSFFLSDYEPCVLCHEEVHCADK
uniref:Uncharacterized protein n=1 Tax=Trichobilharzia regenti TaxID=157069 RepID=A0AA85KHG2_TRIRE|nr:unnamed protein product [Trichobilharzia regenti]